MGPNFRKLLYASALVAGGCAVSAIPGGGIVATAVSGLLGGVAGNLAHQLVDEMDQKFFGKTEPELGLRENHHIQLQLRRSYIRALRQLTKLFEDEASDLSDHTFLKVLNKFLDQAECPSRLLPQADTTNEAKAVFVQLPEVLRAGLSRSNLDNSQATLAKASEAKEELLRLAFDELGSEIGNYCPPTFLSLAYRDENGFIDLFVRDASNALSDNVAFRSIWSEEQRQHSAEAEFDLATVYWRLTQVTNSMEFCQKGLDHLYALRERGQLAPVYENFVPTFETRLRELTGE